MEEQKREFTGIWIPAHIIEDESLTKSEMIIYADISCFKVCYKSNEAIGKRWKLSADRASRIVNSLIKKGYIKSNNKTGEHRELSAVRDEVITRASSRKHQEPLVKNNESLSVKTPTIDNSIEYKENTITKVIEEPSIEDTKEQGSYGKQEINDLIVLFQNVMGFKSSGSKDRMMAKHLLNNFTKEQLRAMLEFCSKDAYAPRVGSIEKLWYKRGDIIAGIKACSNRSPKMAII